MKVSFIIPVYNNLELTRACVDTLQETVRGIEYEVLIVNDGSDAQTAAGLRALANDRVRVIDNARNAGFARANNLGAIEARGELLFLLNNDLALLPGWLEPMLQAFERVENLGLVGNVQLNAATGEIDHSGIRITADIDIEHTKRPNKGRVLSPAYSPMHLITGACCAISREVYLSVGGFDEAYLNGGEDFDLCFRLRALGYKVAVANRSVVKHHVSATRRERSLNDERNSRLLYTRWQDSLVSLAASRWPDSYLSQAWSGRRWPALYSQHLVSALLRYLTLKKGPAPVAKKIALCGLNRREHHWKSVLDGWDDEMIRMDERTKNASPLKDRYEFDGLHSDAARPGCVWIRETASITLPRGTLLSSISVAGYLFPAAPGLTEEKGRLGLAISVNESGSQTYYPIEEGRFRVAFTDPPVAASEQVRIKLTLLGVGKSNALAYFGRVLANAFIIPNRVRHHLKQYREQRLNRRLAIQSIGVNGEDVFNFEKDPTNPLNTEYALKHAQLGVNLVGWFQAELGIGESVRLAAKAIKVSQMPYALIPLKANCLAAQGDTTFAKELINQNRHPVNVFHIDAPQSPDIDHCHGPQFRQGKYNIAYWAWELPDFPDRWTKYFQYFDEVWTPSNFVRDSIVMKSPLPVVTMPHCIDFSIPDRNYRQELGLPEDKFLFNFAYDLNSYQERKNPRAVIEAFKLAFSGTDRANDVGLVIKIHSTRNNAQSHKELLDSLKGVSNYYLIDRTLSREMTYGLMHACDSYVSLHRAEGFGLTVAESMFLSKPVVSTNWSATSEFVNAGNGCPVAFKLTRLERTFGPYEKGQLWADADPEDAANHMRRLVNDSEYAKRLGIKARQTIIDLYSPARIADLYRRRLRAIALW